MSTTRDPAGAAKDSTTRQAPAPGPSIPAARRPTSPGPTTATGPLAELATFPLVGDLVAEGEPP